MSPRSAETPCSPRSATSASRCRRRNGFWAVSEQRVGRAVDRDRDVPVGLADELCELGRERRRVEVGAPADVLRQPALAEPFEHRHRMALVGEVELVVREEDRHAPDSALARPGHGALHLVQHRVERRRSRAAARGSPPCSRHCIAQPMRVRTGNEFAGA